MSTFIYYNFIKSGTRRSIIHLILLHLLLRRLRNIEDYATQILSGMSGVNFEIS